MANGIVSGSVIQRTFVGKNLPTAIFAASVPLDEIGGGSGAGVEFRELLGEVFEVPANALLDELEYQRVAREFIEREMPSRWLHYWPGPFRKEWVLSWERRENELLGEMKSNDRPIRSFAEHSIALMVSGDSANSAYWLGPPFGMPAARAFGVEVDETAFKTGLACLNARLLRSDLTAAFTKGILEYDLPFGNSPRASSDSLQRLLDTGKKMCLAPLAAGGTLGVAHLGQGAYVAAILSVGTGGVMTLILLGSVAVGSLLVSRVAQTRARGGRKG